MWIDGERKWEKNSQNNKNEMKQAEINNVTGNGS